MAVSPGCRDRSEEKTSRPKKAPAAAGIARTALTGDDAGAAGDLSLKHSLLAPARIAEGPDGRLYVTDPGVNSVFVFRNLLPEAELGGLAKPLGVAVDGAGNIYVGNDDRRNIEVYDAYGVKQREIGFGEIQMPNDLALGPDGNLYVADSRADAVKVFAPDGTLLRAIGAGALQFPVAIAIGVRGSSSELYVVDQAHAAIQIFDLTGHFLRGFGVRLELGETAWHGKFVQPQSVAVDAQSRVHVLDTGLSCVQVFDPDTGIYLDTYGGYGAAEGQLNLPLDIITTRDNRVMVANSGNHRIESIR
jgi:DNA-binding beta-propeller fold protein YncE